MLGCIHSPSWAAGWTPLQQTRYHQDNFRQCVLSWGIILHPVCSDNLLREGGILGNIIKLHLLTINQSIWWLG